MKSITTVALIFAVLCARGQPNPLRINPNIALPKDSVESKKLTTALNSFLHAAQKPNEENAFVFGTEKLETFMQLDQLDGVEKSGRMKDDFFYKPYLTNVALLKDSNYLVQVSYMGTNENTAYLRASFEFIAHRTSDSFVFSSSLLRNTKNWKTKKVGSIMFHYRDTINEGKAEEINKLVLLFDSKLKSMNKNTDYYLCNDIIDLQKTVGVDYKFDHNGRTEGVWGASLGNRQLIVSGNNIENFCGCDPHDLFHDRLRLVVSRDKVNRPVDEGCAYLYGGSWGLKWDEIFKAFKEQIASDKATNWMAIKEEPVYFKTRGFSNNADYIVNALLIKKIESEKGSAGVWELLTVGAFEKGNEKYYRALEKLTGITKDNYNESVWELINDEI